MNTPETSSRHLRPTSKGVLRWLGQTEPSCERRLFETLVRAGRETPLDMPAIAARLQTPVRDVAKALFALNRSESVSVIEDAPDRHQKGWREAGLAGLSEDMASMTRPGQSLLLATEDGFQIARVGWGVYEADVMAVQQQLRAAGEGAGGQTPTAGDASHAQLMVAGRCFHICGTAPLDREHGAWLRLAYRLLSAFDQAGPGDVLPNGEQQPC